MTQHIQAVYGGGVLKPLQPLDLAERDVVSLAVEKVADGSESAQSRKSARRTLFDAFNEAGLIGCIQNGPVDLASNPKHMEGFGASGE